MANEADRAQIHEETFRAASLARTTAATGPAPLVIDGKVCCAQCEQPIPVARLQAILGVGLCVQCAAEGEE
jgi:phage/conjugal plasmid C-4 type zinc finger TraR family protein